MREPLATVKRTWVIGALLCATACSGSEGPATSAPAAPEPPGAAAAPGPSESASEDERARVVREAEAFVRAQGYTDTPATATGDEIVHEGIEGTIDDRRNTLDPHAVRAERGDGEWRVIFRYRDPSFAGRGRLLRIRSGRQPSFVHQDLVLPADAPP